jgi:hypothetical protein
MAGFLYYLPRRTGNPTIADLQASPLAYAFDEAASVATCGLTTGPDDGGGVLAADTKRLPEGRLRYEPAAQRWQAMPWLVGNGKAGTIAQAEPAPWVGLWTADRPGPEDLGRRALLDGHWVKMGDDRSWLIPVARGSTDEDGELRWYVALPQRVGLDEAGEWTAGQVVDKYAKLWEVAGRWWAAMAGTVIETADQPDDSGEVVLDFAGCNDAALTALSANYVVGRAEMALLQLLTDQNVREVLNAIIDWPTLSAWLEKKTSAERRAESDAA